MTGLERGLARLRAPALLPRNPLRSKSSDDGTVAPGQPANFETERLDVIGIHLGGHLEPARARASLSITHRALSYFFFFFLTSFFSVIFHCLPAHFLRVARSSLL